MTPRADMDVLGGGFGLDLVIPDVTPVRPQHIHRQNASLHVLVVGLMLAIDLHDGPSIATHHLRSSLSHECLICVSCRYRYRVSAYTCWLIASIPSASSASRPYRRHAMLRKLIVPSSNRLHGRPYASTHKKRGNVEHAEVLLVAGDGDRAAAPVELVQDADVLVPEEQRAESRGEPEHFVEGQRDEVGMNRGQVQTVRRDEGRGIQQDEPLVALGVTGVWEKNVVEVAVLDLFDPAERVFDAREVVLRGVGEERVRVVVVFVAEHFLEVVFADLHAGFVMRHVLLVHHFEPAAEAEGVFADAQHGVVVLEGEGGCNLRTSAR